MIVKKKWYKSKTFWVNILAAFALVAQSQFGWVISPEGSAMILAGINFLLRLITGKPIEW